MQEFQCIHLLTTVELAVDTAWKWAAGPATEIVDLQIFMGNSSQAYIWTMKAGLAGSMENGFAKAIQEKI